MIDPPSVPSMSSDLAVDDSRRQLGAFIDILVSVVMFALMVFAASAVETRTGHPIGGLTFLAFVVGFWAGDVLLYAVPVALWRRSLGNWLTGVRVVDRDSGDRLTIRRAARRYFARRRLLRWLLDAAKRTQMRNAQFGPSDYIQQATMPFTRVGSVFAHSIVATMQGSTAPTVSVADRNVGSAVVRAIERGHRGHGRPRCR